MNSDRKARSRSAVAEDDFFPSFLTATPSSGSQDKSKDNASLSARSQAESLWSQQAKLRRSFAENLVMERRRGDNQAMDENEENNDLNNRMEPSNPFQFSGLQPNGLEYTENYMDRMYPRKRKTTKATPLTPEDDEDVPPPPTTTLSDPASFLNENAMANATLESESLPQRFQSSFATSYVPGDHDDVWTSSKQYWVTVYGFPAASKSVILHQFQELGEVLQYASGTSGNWIHLRYHTRLQAEKALTYDGKKLGGHVMIGVKKCSPLDVEDVTEAMAPSNPPSKYAYAGSDAVQVDPCLSEADIMLPPRRRQDPCSRILAYLLNWS